MTKKLIIEKTLGVINLLPEGEAEEIFSYAEYVLKRYEERKLVAGIQQLASQGATFDFLKEEENIYSSADLKIVYND